MRVRVLRFDKRIRMDVKYNLRNIKVCGEAPRVCASNECGSWWKLKCVCVQSSPPLKAAGRSWPHCAVGWNWKGVRWDSRVSFITRLPADAETAAWLLRRRSWPRRWSRCYILSSKGVRGTNKISCCFKRWASRCSHKYRVASKDRYRGAIINIVLLQKMGIAVQS